MTSPHAVLTAMLERLRETPAMRSKLAIQRPARALARAGQSAVELSGAGQSAVELSSAGQSTQRHSCDELYALPGDDTAAIRCGDQYQLLAIEGMIPAFVEQAPWFAGWSAVMANVSDITAMGGRATAVVNAYWHHDEAAADHVLAGIRAACEAYGLILAGGHTSQAPGNPAALAVAVSGWARNLLSTLHVAPGQIIAMAVDLDGCWHGDAPYWKAFENVAPQRLRDKLEVIPRLAEAGLLHAAKDISNAGILGTLLMLLEPRGCGALIDLSAVPLPADTALERWLQVFPSYGFVMTLDPEDFPTVAAAFAFEGLHCARIGEVDASAQLRVQQGPALAPFWDLARQPFTGFCYPALTPLSKEH